jgi:hypothetical protein
VNSIFPFASVIAIWTILAGFVASPGSPAVKTPSCFACPA